MCIVQKICSSTVEGEIIIAFSQQQCFREGTPVVRTLLVLLRNRLYQRSNGFLNHYQYFTNCSIFEIFYVNFQQESCELER